MNNVEKIKLMLEQIHHENCFILETMIRMNTRDEKVIQMVTITTNQWDKKFKNIERGFIKGDEDE